MQECRDSRWVFTRQELWRLLGGFAPALLIGISDPYFGCEAKRIAVEKRKAESSLHKKGLESFRPDDGSTLVDALALCAHPVYSLIVTSQFAGCRQNRRVIHFRGAQILEFYELDPDHRQLALIPGREALMENLARGLRMDSTSPATSRPVVVDEVAFFAANKACRSGDSTEAGRILKAGGVSPEDAAAILETLLTPAANASVTSVRLSGDTPLVGGWGILEGGGMVWMLRPFRRGERRYTEWVPAGPGTIRAAFERMLS